MPIDPSRVSLRPFRRWEKRTYVELRQKNAEWLDSWEARDPRGTDGASIDYAQIFRILRQQHIHGTAASFAILCDRIAVGHLAFAPLLWGATLQANAGYWVAKSWAGQGIAPAALALGIDEMIHGWGLHRVEVLVQPSNRSSVRVVEKLNLPSEGIRRRAIFVNGAWRDHEVFAVTAEDLPTPGLLTAELGKVLD